jgi:hypothetical protein
MLRLDHLPFYSADLAILADAFGKLGFQVSPHGAYSSPEQPGASWANRGVFLKRGWFDLLLDAKVPPGSAHGPAACLFLTDSLSSSASALAATSTTLAYRLERRWVEDQGLPPATFSLFSVKEPASPLPLAVIEHGYPSRDIVSAWLEHPNTAEELVGVKVARSNQGAYSDLIATVLDVSQLEPCSIGDFERDFGFGAEGAVAVRVRVASLSEAASVLKRDFRRSGDRLLVSPEPGLPCGFEFIGP